MSTNNSGMEESEKEKKEIFWLILNLAKTKTSRPQ